MIDFLKKLFGRTGSSSTAKERLRLVLMTDHLELAPDMIEAMKHDLVDVISRYVEVDRDKIDVTFEQQDKVLAMLANIPILSVNRTNGQPAAETPAATAVAASAAAPEVATSSSTPDSPPKRRRRRRKKSKAAVPQAELVPVSS
ncbi:MAG: cell division topological specificity factor MinE [Candidatus Eremiobacteraeota bacterium]|nr:cell division topological specificity factor MinE [Candidatus Eremiobacteraeota bacterium]